MLKRTCIGLILLFSVYAVGQGVRYENHPAMKTRADGALVPASATIAVCTQPANTSGQPCSPLATLYTDATLATPCTGTLKDGSASGATNCSNPLITDSKGNYHFYAKSSDQLFTIQVYGSGLTTNVEPDVAIAGSVVPSIGAVSMTGPLTVQNLNDKLCVGAAPCYTTVAAAQTAAGAVNKTIIEIRSSYAGTDCGTPQTNIIYLDYRGMNPPCNTNNSILLGPSTSSVTQMALEVMMQAVSPTSGQAVTATQFNTFVTGTLPGAGGIVDGHSATAFTTGALSGTLGTLRGAEIASVVNGAGGTVTVAEGLAGYVGGAGGTTTTIGTVRGINGAGCNGQTYGVAPTNCYGGWFPTQQAKGATRNYSAAFQGPALLVYEGAFASAAQLDAEDNTNTAHPFIKIDSANNTTINAVASQGILLRDSGFTARAKIDGTNGFTVPTACTITNAQIAGSVAAVCALTSQKSESALDNNVLTFTPPAVAGSYRIRFTMAVSAQNTATLGWTATWKDSNGQAQAPTNLSLFTSGTAAPALTVTAATNGVYYGEAQVDIDSSATNIVVKLTFTGTSFTAKVSATIERII